MHCIHVNSSDAVHPTIYIEGRLDAATVIETELHSILERFKDASEIYIDLSKAESICEECFKVFHSIRMRYPIMFQGYSLFAETQLISHDLLRKITTHKEVK